MTELLKDPAEFTVIPLLRAPDIAPQREVTIVECVPASFRLIPGTRVVLGSVKDVGGFWR